MKPFLLLSTRADDRAAAEEHAAFVRFGGLTPDLLHRVRLEAEPLPDLDLDRYSGVFIGGSPFNSSDPEDLKSAVQRRVEAELAGLLDEIVDRDFPFLGACYGVGTLGVHQGAVIDSTFGEPVSSVSITLSEAGRADPLLAGIPPRFDAFVGHKEACRSLPDHVTLLASSPTCPVQMFRVKQNLYATQFHPELDVPGIVLRIKTYRNAGYFPPDDTEHVVAGVQDAEVNVPPRILANFVRRYGA
ncbi:glutamine amidotransferase [Pengzhenrongella frigida]|uniref:Glutamine amidotransferase n=1 Tax=Pengzhenrongella frigida TaxID=1259133 RepID=A0A4Q5N0H5_9MICO|nr:glutamine amidotransferase [Cellulomonas sp. HLT2-17]RYV51530.1 glutamine amidotransferase [Cellulomonas sp. HLT2-17]